MHRRVSMHEVVETEVATVESERPAGAEACGAPLWSGLDDALVERVAGTLKALGHPARVRLVAAIRVAEGGEACVCDLQQVVGLSQPTVSHHLKVLVDAGLLTREKRGQWSWYALDEAAWAAVGELFA